MMGDNNDYDSINQEILKTIQISSQEHMLIKSLEKFYFSNNNMNIMLPIVRGESNISMRLIDFFVTNYSKRNRVTYNIEENGVKNIFNVYLSYKSQLKAFNKKYFDPFSRGNRIPFFFPDDCIITTIGQLNFFKWAINNLILDYISLNYKEIENDMNICYNNIHKVKETNSRKKRQEISKSATRGLNSNKIKVVIEFN